RRSHAAALPALPGAGRADLRRADHSPPAHPGGDPRRNLANVDRKGVAPPIPMRASTRRSRARRRGSGTRGRRSATMRRIQTPILSACILAVLLWAVPGQAADYPTPAEGTWVVRDFRFHTGEVLPELRLHYTTVGSPTGEPVLILHGTTQSGAAMLTPTFAGELFGPGQPLDAARYYVILPDAIGTGKSSKPSDGLRASFPRYNYDDMVDAQYRLVKEHLGIAHLRMVLGNSMGGMHTWIWAQKYPGFMDVAVPMASTPA